MEDSFSMDRDEEGSGSTVSHVEQQMKLCSVATHLLLCGPVGGPGANLVPWPKELKIKLVSLNASIFFKYIKYHR